MNVITRALIALWIFLLVGMSSTSMASAHSAVGGGQDNDLALLVKEAGLIAITTVEDVQYQTATFSDGNGMMPVSFVTVRIDKILSGRHDAQRLTLRFMGGPDGMGGVMGVSGVPTLQKGDRDILFIADNGSTRCALVLCEWGRYRILKDRVYNTHGFPVLSLAKNHALARGMPPAPFRTVQFPSPKFDDLLKNPLLKDELPGMIQSRGLTIDQAREHYETSAPKFIELKREYDPKDFEPAEVIGPANQSPQKGPNLKIPALKLPLQTPAMALKAPVHLNEFMVVVAKLARTSLGSTRAIERIDQTTPVVFKPISKAMPPKLRAASQPAVKESSADRTWREAEERDPFNPGQKPAGAK